MVKLLIVKAVPKTEKDYGHRQTDKTTHRYNYETLDKLDVSEDFIRLLRAHDPDAMNSLRTTLRLRGKAKGKLIIEVARGGCRRFHHENGMPKMCEVII